MYSSVSSSLCQAKKCSNLPDYREACGHEFCQSCILKSIDSSSKFFPCLAPNSECILKSNSVTNTLSGKNITLIQLEKEAEEKRVREFKKFCSCLACAGLVVIVFSVTLLPGILNN